ncbi:MAG TPA: hypothetical protein VMM38_01315 [Aridibacter sp.]|nr:hypothetical protein [Aridibacter sp.]
MTDEPRLEVIEETSILLTDDEEIFQVGAEWPPSGAVAGFTHSQISAELVWTVNHNLGYRPNVEIRTPGGEVVLAEVLHVNENQLTITFAAPTAGTARVI